MEDEYLVCAKYIQLIQSVPIGRKSCCIPTLYWNIVYRRDYLPIPTDSAVCRYLVQYPSVPFSGLICIGTTYSCKDYAFKIP